MLSEIYYQFLDVASRFFDKTIIFLSFVFGILLCNIGYPKEVLSFIFILVIFDLIIKHISIVVKTYGSFTPSNYKKAWTNKHLTSRELKNGLCIKTGLYYPLMYISHKIGIIPEMILGAVISNTLYTMVILVEISSIFESFIDMGYTNLIPFLNIINKKKDEIVGENKTNIK